MCQAPKPLVEEFPQTLLNAEFYSAAMRSENDSDHDRLNAGRGLFLLNNQISSFCVVSQLEFALQAAQWCHGAGDSKSADVPLGGERPLCYLSSVITYKFDVRLPFSR